MQHIEPTRTQQNQALLDAGLTSVGVSLAIVATMILAELLAGSIASSLAYAWG